MLRSLIRGCFLNNHIWQIEVSIAPKTDKDKAA